jgi:hypothetical protein
MSERTARPSWHGITASVVVIAVVLGVLAWAGTQLLKIDRIDLNLSSQKDKLEEIDKQVKSMRLVFRDYMLDDKPDRKGLIKRLAKQEPTPLYIGMANFVEGKYDAAFNLWIPAAQRGDQESREVAEAALVKLYRGASGDESVKRQIAAGALIELFKAPAYDPNDPKVLKFKNLLDDLGSSKRQAPPRSPTPFKGGIKAPAPIPDDSGSSKPPATLQSPTPFK